MLTLGIDLGGSSIKAVVLRRGGVVTSAQSAIYDHADRATIESELSAVVAALRNLHQGALDGPLRAVGLCVPGVVEAGRITRAVHLPGLVGVEIIGLVRSIVDGSADRRGGSVPVVVTTDAAATAIDLSYRVEPGNGPFAGRLAAVCLGTGVGLGVVDGGVPLRVDGASAGHLGQIDVGVELDDGTVPIGPDGGRGSLEAYCSAAAMRGRFGHDLTTVFERVDASDPILRALARAIRIVHAIYRPRIVVLAGGIGLAMRPCAEVVRALVEAELTDAADPRWQLFVADRIDHAACGAARVAAEDLSIED